MDCFSLICAGLFLRLESGYQYTPTPPAPYKRWYYDRNHADPWLGAITLGWQYEVSPRLIWEISIRHESMPRVGDRGEDAYWTAVTWRPFR